MRIVYISKVIGLIKMSLLPLHFSMCKLHCPLLCYYQKYSVIIDIYSVAGVYRAVLAAGAASRRAHVGLSQEGVRVGPDCLLLPI